MCSFKHHTRFDCKHIYKILLYREYEFVEKAAGPFFSRHFRTQHFRREIFHINYENLKTFFVYPNHSFKLCKESVSRGQNT